MQKKDLWIDKYDGKTYEELFNEGIELVEKNDCSVRAFSLCTDLPYSFCFNVLKANGRKDGRGLASAIILDVIQEFCEVKPLNIDTVKQQLKVNRVLPYHFLKYRKYFDAPIYLVFSNGHVFVVKDGLPYDWVRDYNIKVKRIYEIRKHDSYNG